MRRKTGIFIIIGVLLVIALAVVGLTVTGFLPKLLGMAPPPGTVAAEQDKKEAEKPKGPPTEFMFVDLPDLYISLNTRGKGNHLLKLGLSLQTASAEDTQAIQPYMPRIIDVVQVFVRDLDIQDVQGIENFKKLRGELLNRLNAALGGHHVDVVLLREVLIQ